MQIKLTEFIYIGFPQYNSIKDCNSVSTINLRLFYFSLLFQSFLFNDVKFFSDLVIYHRKVDIHNLNTYAKFNLNIFRNENEKSAMKVSGKNKVIFVR